MNQNNNKISAPSKSKVAFLNSNRYIGMIAAIVYAAALIVLLVSAAKAG